MRTPSVATGQLDDAFLRLELDVSGVRVEGRR